jgi:hypothetical protein
MTTWVFRQMSAEGFLDCCHRRVRFGNQKSQEVRTAKAEEWADQIRAFKAAFYQIVLRRFWLYQVG